MSCISSSKVELVDWYTVHILCVGTDMLYVAYAKRTSYATPHKLVFPLEVGPNNKHKNPFVASFLVM